MSSVILIFTSSSFASVAPEHQAVCSHNIRFCVSASNSISPKSPFEIEKFLSENVIPLLGNLVIPSNIEIRITVNPNSDFEKPTLINLGLLSDSHTQLTMNHSFATVAHEYGHAIFFANLLDHGKELEGASREDVAVYNEFFGDVVAVLSTKAGDAMTWGRSEPLAQNSRLNFLDRDLTNLEPLIDPVNGSIDEHYFFFEARRLIWTEFLRSGETTQSANKLIRLTLQAIVNHKRAYGVFVTKETDFWKEHFSSRALSKIENTFSSELRKLIEQSR